MPRARRCLLTTLLLLGAIAPFMPAQAIPVPGVISVLETAPLGVTNGGTAIIPYGAESPQFLGARFTLTTRTLITSVGGHVKGYSDADRSLFVAIAPLVSGSIFPSDVFLSGAVFHQSFIAPFNDVGPYPYQVPETLLSTHFVLGPGDYSIMFGSGLFGATGSGWMPIAPYDFGDPSYFFMNSHMGSLAFHDRGFQPARFVVEGRPLNEPGTLALCMVSLVAFAMARRKRRAWAPNL